MAIGDSNFGGNNQNRNNIDSSFYSRYRFRNGDKNLAITYRSGLMIVEIGEVGSEGFKTTPLQTIYISPMKATLLSGEIKNFLEYRAGDSIDPNKAFGVNAGMGEKITYIALSTNDDKDIILTIGKFDGAGKVLESATFTFQKDYNYSLQWDNLEANELVRNFNNEVEFTVFSNAVTDFARYMTGAAGYATLDLNRYEVARDRNSINQIFDRLGIERNTGNNNRSYNSGSNNFLNNSSSRSTSIDEVEDLLV